MFNDHLTEVADLQNPAFTEETRFQDADPQHRLDTSDVADDDALQNGAVRGDGPNGSEPEVDGMRGLDPQEDNQQDAGTTDYRIADGEAPAGSAPRGTAEPPDSDRGAVDPSKLPLARVEAEICTLAGQIAAATSRFLRLLADFDTRKGWAGFNVRSCAQWLSWRCGLDLRTAREHVRVARALTDLPKIRQCFDTGKISYSKVRAIARVATPTSEEELLEAALHAPAAHVERLTRGLRAAQRHSDRPDDPDDTGLKPLPDPDPALRPPRPRRRCPAARRRYPSQP
jgi:hypothetical protein